jgi:hypothetical protein
MKKVILLVVFILMVSFSPAEPFVNLSNPETITAQECVVYAEPNVNSTKVQNLPPGLTVQVLERRTLGIGGSIGVPDTAGNTGLIAVREWNLIQYKNIRGWVLGSCFR